MRSRAPVRAIMVAMMAACLSICAGLLPQPASAARDATAPAPARIEARSSTLLAVGIVHEDRMAIHLSRLVDNTPLRDAAVTVVLRGVAHPTIAEADGGYTLQTKDLLLPGSAAVVFKIAADDVQQELKGAVQVAADPVKPADKNTTRQLAWWVLNFAVCIGFLVLWNRRRRPAEPDAPPSA